MLPLTRERHSHRVEQYHPVDKYINTGICADCGEAAYSLSAEFDSLGNRGKDRVFDKITELSKQNGAVVTQETKIKEETKVDTLLPVPARPANKTPRIISKYYEQNTKQILEEIKSTSMAETRDRWGFSWNAWASFCLRNNIERPDKGKHYNRKSHTPQRVVKTGNSETKDQKFETKLGKTIDEIKPPHIANVCVFVVTHELPALPAFNEAWQPEMKQSWMYTCHDLVEFLRVPAGVN